jgi:hypothetical protein
MTRDAAHCFDSDAAQTMTVRTVLCCNPAHDCEGAEEFRETLQDTSRGRKTNRHSLRATRLA